MKTLRAEEHLKRLQEAAERFPGPEAIAIREKDDVEHGVHVIRFELKVVIPNEIPLLLGEFAYNLRSGLDQLAWQLALLGGHTPTSKTAFPIYGKRADKTFQRFTRDIPSKAVEVIKSLQPYKRGDDFQAHPLWRLNELCNLDKHVTLPINSTELKIESGPAKCDILARRVRFDYGVELHIPLRAKGKIYFNPRTPELIFGRPANEPGSPFELRFGDIV